MCLLEAEREAARKERQELLNRIAAPERVVVDGSPAEHKPEPMTLTDLELSFVGGEVPDGVSVGSLRDADVRGGDA
jgi:hypothetical protein